MFTLDNYSSKHHSVLITKKNVKWSFKKTIFKQLNVRGPLFLNDFRKIYNQLRYALKLLNIW